jgi:Ca-activated chloride channel family protein
MHYREQLRAIAVTALASVFIAHTLNPVTAQQPAQTRPRKVEQAQNGKPDQQPQDSSIEALKIATEMVQLDVKVVDQNGRPVPGMTKNDFVVYEDKVRQEIESVSREEVPISLGVLIDTSGSMRPKLWTVSDAASDLIRQMRPDDEAFIGEFKEETKLVQDFSSNRLRLTNALRELYSSGGTALLDAIIAGADHMYEKGKRRRKALVVITDGLENHSSVKEREVIRAMKEDEVQLYLVGIIDGGGGSWGLFGKSPEKKAKDLLIRLAEDSGGRAFFPKEVGEMPMIAAQIAADLRAQYVVSYYPSNDLRNGAFRTVRVEAASRNNRKLIASTRQGYYAHANLPQKR